MLEWFLVFYIVGSIYHVIRYSRRCIKEAEFVAENYSSYKKAEDFLADGRVINFLAVIIIFFFWPFFVVYNWIIKIKRKKRNARPTF